MSVDRRTVVVGVDDSGEARSALRWAAEQARLCSARLKVVHAFQPHHLAGVFGIAKLQPDAEWRVDARRWLSEVVEEELGDVADLELEPHVAQDGPAAAILAAADGAALIVVGSRGHGAAGSALHGSVSSAVLRHARCPVVVVPSRIGGPGRHPTPWAHAKAGSFDDWMAVWTAGDETAAHA
jgi:nucleotide-binding universal stress UspA family protein